jgi:hypothetical protein
MISGQRNRRRPGRSGLRRRSTPPAAPSTRLADGLRRPTRLTT